MTSPKRITHRNRYEKLPPKTKLVTRATRYGNPYPVGEYGRDRCLVLFKEYAQRRLHEEPLWLESLRGYDLACICQQDEKCHGDILLLLANRGNTK